MKILASCTYFRPYVSGLTRYVERVCDAMVALGEDVSVITIKHDNTLTEDEVDKGLHIVRAVPTFKLNKTWISFNFLIKTVNLVRETDLVWVNLPQLEAVWLMILAKLFKKRLIATYHCDMVMGNIILETAVDTANMLVCAGAQTVIAYTQDYATRSRILPMFAAKIRYIYPPTPYPTSDEYWDSKLREVAGGAKIAIGIAARLATEKGIEYAIEALDYLDKGAILIICGPTEPVGETSYKQKITGLTAKYKDRIKFVGVIPDRSMGSFYKNIDVLVVSSVNATESFGLVQVEAMLMGVPVVATDLPGVRVPVTKTGMGMVVPTKSAKKIAEAIEWIHKNGKSINKSKKQARDIFNIDHTINFYREVFTSPTG